MLQKPSKVSVFYPNVHLSSASNHFHNGPHPPPRINTRRKAEYHNLTILVLGMRWHSWLRHCATSRKVVGSIPDGVIGIFHWHNPSGRTVAPGSTQPLTEMRTRNISWGLKAASVWGWQPYHLRVPTVLNSGSLNLLKPTGPVQACNGNALPLTILALPWRGQIKPLKMKETFPPKLEFNLQHNQCKGKC